MKHLDEFKSTNVENKIVGYWYCVIIHAKVISHFNLDIIAKVFEIKKPVNMKIKVRFPFQ